MTQSSTPLSAAALAAGAPLRDLEPRHAFFVGIDSDGCAFNSMEVKHNDCFSVNVVKHFGLAALSRQVHQVWDFVNLYSQTRGCNRFKALASTMDLLAEMPRVKRSGIAVPRLPYLHDWIAHETTLGNPTLAAKIASAQGAEKAELALVMAWSKDVNASVADIVKNLPPFAGTRTALERLQGKADVVVVSATPEEALKREWSEHGIDAFVRVIAGQEMGSKNEHLQMAAQSKYDKQAILMIGDAPGDLKAARSIGALFFPITPGAEEESWERFVGEGLERFLAGRYAGDYEAALIEAFMKQLPADPPWAR